MKKLAYQQILVSSESSKARMDTQAQRKGQSKPTSLYLQWRKPNIMHMWRGYTYFLLFTFYF